MNNYYQCFSHFYSFSFSSEIDAVKLLLIFSRDNVNGVIVHYSEIVRVENDCTLYFYNNNSPSPILI